MKKGSPDIVGIELVETSLFNGWNKSQPASVQAWIKRQDFTGKSGSHCVIYAANGMPLKIVAAVSTHLHLWSLAGLPDTLPSGQYHLVTKVNAHDANQLLLGWLLGCYQFSRYKKSSKTSFPSLHIDNADTSFVNAMAQSLCHARDLINFPANDLGPEELANAAKAIAKKHSAKAQEIIGEKLVSQNYPAIYEVGKASSRAPRLVDVTWGNPKHPKVTLVGKGVCFDSGGLDIKPSSGMKLMKKDMGGAACVLALADMIMTSKLPVRLRVLIPAVENSIAGNAYRPSDIIKTRKGITVEVGNTDAEGRLILCDALYEADQESPDLLIDCATLTGAARTALGTDIPAVFTADDALATAIMKHSIQEHDPLWRLPLWQGYREMLQSHVADINSAPDSGYGGAITAALYLQEFVQKTNSWMHIDMMAWNLGKRAGRPVGGEAMAVRALFSLISERFGSKKKAKL